MKSNSFVRKELLEAKSLLSQWAKVHFKKWEFNPYTSRLIGSDGWYLQWVDEKTNRGIVTLEKMSLNRFYFDTGVRPPSPLHADQVWRNGTKQIPFDCEAPIGSELVCCVGTPDVKILESPFLKSFPIFNTSLLASYAYFRLPKGGVN